MFSSDEVNMSLALEVAKIGKGQVSPNPLVGCVIVQDGILLGVGWHQKYGDNHAEINALNSCYYSPAHSTVYVNLEPCAHYGKTPPCVDALITAGVSRVVISTLDPNPLVEGKGVEKLKQFGIKVDVGIRKEEALELNKFFFKHITTGKPYVLLKMAQTLDGKIADLKGESKWISSLESRKYVHELRSEYDAVMVGAGTVKKDNPHLNIRLLKDSISYSKKRNPVRIVLDTNLSLKTDYNVFDLEQKTIVITSLDSKANKRKINSLTKKGIEIIFVKKNKSGLIDISSALIELGKKRIASIIVEGGNKLFSSFINSDEYDEILLFNSPGFLGKGIEVFSSSKIYSINQMKKLKIVSVKKIGDDAAIFLRKNK